MTAAAITFIPTDRTALAIATTQANNVVYGHEAHKSKYDNRPYTHIHI